MKKLNLFITLIAIAFIGIACSNEVPETVTKTLLDKFPKADSVLWEQESSGLWEAEFKMNGSSYSISIEPDGRWIETEIEGGIYLPIFFKRAIDKKYPGFEIDEFEQIETLDFEGYELLIKKGISSKEILIGLKGGKIDLREKL